MNISMEKKKEEALKRMKAIGLLPQAIKLFEAKTKWCLSETPYGTYFIPNQTIVDHVKKLEEQYNILVYTAMHSYTGFGEIYSFLYVSDNPEEWEKDNQDLTKNEAVAYAYNKDDDNCSEFGYIGFDLTPAKGLRRIY